MQVLELRESGPNLGLVWMKLLLDEIRIKRRLRSTSEIAMAAVAVALAAVASKLPRSTKRAVRSIWENCGLFNCSSLS